MPEQETGHAKNVSNFESLISFCTGYGVKYNPSQEVLQVDNLQIIWASSKTALGACKKSETAYDNASDERRDVFNGIKKIGTRVVNALAASGVADNIVEGAQTINKKLQGQRSTPKEEPKKAADGTDLPSTSSSSSQQGFDNLIEHLNGLVELVSSQPAYAPNEEDLKVVSLQAYVAVLEASNTGVKNANAAWSNSRIERDTIMYGDKTGLVDVALDVKKYVKSAFGATSAQLKQISGLAFKRFPA